MRERRKSDPAQPYERSDPGLREPFLPTRCLALEIRFHAKSGSMPTDHRLWSDDNERLLPGRPKPASDDREEFVERAEFRFGVLALQDCQLLSQGHLQEQTPTEAKQASECPKPQPEKTEHERGLYQIGCLRKLASC